MTKMEDRITGTTAKRDDMLENRSTTIQLKKMNSKVWSKDSLNVKYKIIIKIMLCQSVPTVSLSK